MRVYLAPIRERIGPALQHLHSVSQPRLHTLVDDPASADLILVAGGSSVGFAGIDDNPLVRRFPKTCFMYDDSDGFVPLLPGIYTNARRPRLVDLHRTESSAFVVALNPQTQPLEREKRYLFTFAGGSTSLVRKRLYRIDWHRDDVLVENTSSYYHWDAGQDGREERQQRYAETIASSRFALCPRGASAGSQRLFEVMQMGVAPVLISDHYDLPVGPDWSRFLIRVRERDIARLPEILEQHIETSAERGRIAREEWERHFAPETMFNTLIAAYGRIGQRSRISETWVRPFWGALKARHEMGIVMMSIARRAVLGIFRRLHIPFVYQLNR